MSEASPVPLGSAAPPGVLVELDELAERGVLAPIDRHFARTLSRLSRERTEVLLAAAFTSRALRLGHVCVDLARLCEAPLHDEAGEVLHEFSLPPLEPWLGHLSGSGLVATSGERRPLVLEGTRLYLHRYWEYQRSLAARIRARTGEFAEISADGLRQGLSELFGAPGAGQSADMQRVAAVVAACKRFTVISGGPGTGKTHTVVKVLALLQAQARALGEPWLRMLMVAPTGKAAARLSESVSANLPALADHALAAAIPSEAFTIHRALGYQARTPTQFRHDAANPLPVDVLLIDEASMIDLSLLSKLVAAAPASARLILLGDKDQLASVEAGAVFGDIFNPDAEHGFSSELAERVRELAGVECAVRRDRASSGIWDSIVHLTRSFRYGEGSGIAALANAVNRGDGDAALDVLTRARKKPQLTFDFASSDTRSATHDVALVEAADAPSLYRATAALIEAAYAPYCRERDPAKKLALLNQFRVLCAHRRGEFGVEALNQVIEQRLAQRRLLRLGSRWYDGRPILVTQNDYQLELFNGDVGVLVSEPGRGLRAHFLRPDGQLRSFVPARLPPHETVFAMTVHKSQGSEFDAVLLILPPEPSPIVTRELVYTGITRAKRRVELCATRASFSAAVAARVERASGLRSALWDQPQAPFG